MLTNSFAENGKQHCNCACFSEHLQTLSVQMAGSGLWAVGGGRGGGRGIEVSHMQNFRLRGEYGMGEAEISLAHIWCSKN